MKMTAAAHRQRSGSVKGIRAQGGMRVFFMIVLDFSKGIWYNWYKYTHVINHSILQRLLISHLALFIIMRKEKPVLMKKRFVTLIVAAALVIIAISAFKTSELINIKLTESAYSNLSSSVGQIETSISANWIQDAENLNETASILSNSNRPDEILKNIEPNDAVYRYLYVVQRPEEATASDGSTIQRDDSPEFFPVYSFDSIDRSEAFLGSMGEWTYLYRCPVIRDGETGGEIYAQYLFKKLDKIIPEKSIRATETIIFSTSKPRRSCIKEIRRSLPTA